MMSNVHPELHLAIHRRRVEEVTRAAALAQAARDLDRRIPWAVRLGRAIHAAVTAGRHAFRETVAVQARTEERGSVR